MGECCKGKKQEQGCGCDERFLKLAQRVQALEHANDVRAAVGQYETRPGLEIFRSPAFGALQRFAHQQDRAQLVQALAELVDPEDHLRQLLPRAELEICPLAGVEVLRRELLRALLLLNRLRLAAAGDYEFGQWEQVCELLHRWSDMVDITDREC